MKTEKTKTVKPVSQKMKILHHLREVGSITPLEALGTMGCFRLQARINELRMDGWHISTTMKRDINGKTYARYSFASDTRVS